MECLWGDVNDPAPPSSPQQEGRILGWLNAVKGLTITNALVIFLLVVIAIPAYFAYSAINNEALLDRFLSNYRELSSQNVACVVREAKYRGGNPIWTISTGFAFHGRDRYLIGVALDYEPNNDALQSYCETLKLIADNMGEDTVQEAVSTEGRP
jgi:hypothetical protein